MAIGGSPLPWADRELFAELMLSWEMRTYQTMVETYTEFGYQLIELPRAEVETRIELVTELITTELATGDTCAAPGRSGIEKRSTTGRT